MLVCVEIEKPCSPMPVVTAPPSPSSGGSGRTGTFVTIANLLDCLKSEGVVDVFQTVRTLRLQRPNMVRTVVSCR